MCSTSGGSWIGGWWQIANRWIPPERYAQIRRGLYGRDALITDILWETGFRLDDVMYIRTCRLRSRVLKLTERKTGHQRQVEMSQELWLRCRAFVAKRNNFAYAFPALRRHGRRKMHRTTYWRHFMAAVKAAGYGDAGYSPHSLRKCYAVRRLSETGSLAAVQADLGHTKPEVTMIYAFSDKMG